MATVMQSVHIPVQVVHSRIIHYYPCLVDLRWSRSIHSCDVCPALSRPPPAPSSSSTSNPAALLPPRDAHCSAVHYGICQPVRSAPFKSSLGSLRTGGSRTIGVGVALERAPPPVPAAKGRRITVPITVKTTVTNQKPTTPPIASPPVSDKSNIAIPITINRIGQPTSPEESVIRISSIEPINRGGDGEGDLSFLRQKEAELKLKREREKEKEREKEGGAAAAATVVTTATPTVTNRLITRGAGTQGSGAQTVLPIQRVITKQRAEESDVTVTPGVVPEDVPLIVPPAPKPVPAVSTPVFTDLRLTTASVSEPPSVVAPSSPKLRIDLDTNTVAPSLLKTETKFTPPAAAPEVSLAPQTQAGTVAVEPTVSSSTVVAVPVPPKSSTVQQLRQLGSAVPRFYYPLGRPTESEVITEDDEVLQRCRELFDSLPDGKVTKQSVAQLLKACGLPFYWKQPFYFYCGGDKAGHVTLASFTANWKQLMSECYDEASRFLRITSRSGRNYIEYDDLLPLVQDVVDTHPGLTFLLDAPEFHSRYVQTVISRIFYSVNSSWSERISLRELRKSKLLQTVRFLEEEDDINRITDFFSYEHFYVIYCKFWELDKDHDLLISKEDLGRHNDHAISSRMIDRVFSGAVTRKLVDGKLSYRDFVWFLISEEDKKHPRSIEYWFRCMDLDGDGVISMYEMEYFYEEQVEKMEILGIETLPFQDCLCQMLDMIRPEEPGRIRLKDLKSCSLTPIFFDTFFNLDKYLEHEQKDPFASLRDQDNDEAEMSDWGKYAAEEYELLVAEEGASDLQQEEQSCEGESDPNEGGSTAAADSSRSSDIP